MQSSDNQVLIIGAGLGGLALGQILQANNIPFQIFERDLDLDARNQGWAIALNTYAPSPFPGAII
jgi:2-polyprenyl-6-methoxyphenol hydroxylase-like FAD-dependent oxidoreductase